ncbi:MAG: flavodoxin [Anaerolineae bacterium]|nr:flavodoxin [Anaerolineae bacterium]
MPDKILIAYASRAGSTASIAHAIGKTLTDCGILVDVYPMQDIHDISPYRAVIAGSAVQKSKWLPEAMHFMKQHQTELAQKPFATFLVCLALAVKDPQRQIQAQKQASNWLQPVRDLVTPLSEGMFAGVLDLSKIPIGYRILFRMVIALGFFAEGDYRDWDAIAQWATTLPEKLLATTTHTL